MQPLHHCLRRHGSDERVLISWTTYTSLGVWQIVLEQDISTQTRVIIMMTLVWVEMSYSRRIAIRRNPRLVWSKIEY